MRKLAAVVLLCALLLSGCSGLTGNADTLMEPPQLTGEQQVVRTALKAAVGSEITLAYPASGAYRDAVILHDFQNGWENGAVAFYRDDSRMIHIAVLMKRGGEWNMVGDIATGMPAIDFAEFVGSNIVMGFDTQQNTEYLMQVFSVSDGPTAVVYESNYQAACVTDLNNDKSSDILVVKDSGNGSLAASLVVHTGNTFTRHSTVPLHSDIVSVHTVTDGYTGENEHALFVDGVIGRGSLMTQILVVQEDRLVNLLLDDGAAQTTLRNQTVACQKGQYDIVEIPTLSLLPGYSDTAIPQYLTDWSVYRGGKLQYSRSSFISQILGFSYDVPQDLRGKITFRYAYESKRVDILGADDVPIDENQHLLGAIAVFSAEELRRSGFVKLGEIGTSVYGCTSYGNSSDPLYQGLDQIRQRFSILIW